MRYVFSPDLASIIEADPGHTELDHGDPTAGLHDAGELAHGRRGIVNVAQKIREGEVVERRAVERQVLGASFDDRLEYTVARPRHPEHVRALVEPDDRAAEAIMEGLSDHARAGGDIEHAVRRARVDDVDERAPPSRILTERKDRRDPVI